MYICIYIYIHIYKYKYIHICIHTRKRVTYANNQILAWGAHSEGQLGVGTGTLQYVVAVRSSALQYVAVCCTLQGDTVCFVGAFLEGHLTVCCSVVQRGVVRCSVLQSVAVCCSLLQCVAVCCSVLQLLQCVCSLYCKVGMFIVL